jgi:chorismate synthase
MLRFYTAGESHGQALLAFVSGLPASLPIDVDFINHELHRRQLGYGRGGRQKIEKDRADIFAGVRHGKTIGAPVALRIENRDWANWEKILPVQDPSEDDAPTKKLVAPRPGHADLAGSQKFDFHDARYILERASARETASRVAAAAFAKLLLRQFGTEIASHTVQVGHVKLDRKASWDEILRVSADLDSPLRCVDSSVQDKMKAEVDAALKAGDTVGGIFEVIAHNIPVGLGSHAQWDEKLDGRLAQAVMSIQAVKGVEIGAGVTAAGSYGSEVQDEISYDKSARRFRRSSNRAGGLEGGITNGEDVIVRGYLKPISTLRRALGTADMVTKEPVKPWLPLCSPMLFCKNLEETLSPRCDGISITMPDKSTSSEATQAAPAPETVSAARKIYPIVKYGDPILEKPTTLVKNFDAELEQLAEDMFASMYAAQGVGLAAPQIGLHLRMAVVDVTGGKNPEAKIVLANPEIIHAEGEKREEEGCLSVPGFRGYVLRPQFVTVKAQNAKGESFEIRGEDLLARAFCHEIDHLNGILFIQHLSMLKRDLIKRKIKKLRKQGEW